MPPIPCLSAFEIPSGALNESVPQNICFLVKFLLAAGDLPKIECPCKESVAGKLEVKDATPYFSG